MKSNGYWNLRKFYYHQRTPSGPVTGKKARAIAARVAEEK